MTLIVVWWLAYSRAAQIALDRPNKRSLHDKPTPRTGGLGLHAGVLLAWAMAGADMPASFGISILGLLGISLIDDMRGLPVLSRLIAHLLASTAVTIQALIPGHGFVAACVATIGITWIINLYNFMDGADGLAGGMTFFGFGFYGIAAWEAGSTGFALLNLSIASSAAAFLLFNFHPARLFMGDVGAVPLGFLAGANGLIGWIHNDWFWWFPLLVFSPFIVDASVTLSRRILSGMRFWEAHRDHYYQRLIRMGWSHRYTTLAEYLIMTLCGCTAIAGLHWQPAAQFGLLLSVALFYLLILVLLEFRWQKHIAGNRHAA